MGAIVSSRARPSDQYKSLSDATRETLDALPVAVQQELAAFIEANAKPAASSADRGLAPAAQPPACPQPSPAAELDLKTPVAPSAPKEIVALAAAELEEAVARYSKTTVLRALLTHDPALGGVAIKLVSVRWLITYFQANPSARLEHRQHLERMTPEAFVEGAKLERVLAELESGGSHGLKDPWGDPIKGGVYMTEVGGEFKAVTRNVPVAMYGGNVPVEIAFPSAAAMSHMCAFAALELRRGTRSPARCPLTPRPPPRCRAQVAVKGPSRP